MTLQLPSDKAKLQTILSRTLLLGGLLLSTATVHARPRPPVAPVPELGGGIFLSHADFDDAFWLGIRDDSFTNDTGIFTSSWSGYGLERLGTVTPLLIPGVSAFGQTNLGQSFRAWV